MSHLSNFLSSLNLPLLVIGFLFWVATYAFTVTNLRSVLRRYFHISVSRQIVLGLVIMLLWTVPFFIDWKTGLVLACVCYALEGIIAFFLVKRKNLGLSYVDVLNGVRR